MSYPDSQLLHNVDKRISKLPGESWLRAFSKADVMYPAVSQSMHTKFAQVASIEWHHYVFFPDQGALSRGMC